MGAALKEIKNQREAAFLFVSSTFWKKLGPMMVQMIGWGICWSENKGFFLKLKTLSTFCHLLNFPMAFCPERQCTLTTESEIKLTLHFVKLFVQVLSPCTKAEAKAGDICNACHAELQSKMKWVSCREKWGFWWLFSWNPSLDTQVLWQMNDDKFLNAYDELMQSKFNAAGKESTKNGDGHFWPLSLL